MNKLKAILVALALLLIIPFGVYAEESTDQVETTSKEVNVYLFHGDGCPHCEEARNWFSEIEDEHGSKFNLIDYEVWYNQENNELMSIVAEVRKEKADSIPYIIVGNQSWSGFPENYKAEILSKIDSEYAQEPEKRYDVMNYVSLVEKEEEKSTTARDILISLVLVGVIAAVIGGTVIARKNTN